MDPFICAFFGFLIATCRPENLPPPVSPTPRVETGAPIATATPAVSPLPTTTPTPRSLRLPPPAQATEIAAGPSTTNKIALPFDAGIRSPHIVPVLDHLKAASVRSTMFLTGWWADQHPEIVARLVADGHELGNHRYSHPNVTAISNSAIREELERGDDAIFRHGGVRTKPWFRPPSGDRDTPG